MSYSFRLFVEVDVFSVLVRMEGCNWWPVLLVVKLLEILTVLLRDLVLQWDVRVGQVLTSRSKIFVVESCAGYISTVPLLI